MANRENLELKDVFEKERFPNSNWQFVSILVYFPFGLVLAILRLFIGFHACLVALVLTHTPFIRSIVLRMLCLVLGINVEQNNQKERDKATKVIVSNCVTKLDHIAFHLTTDCVAHSKWDGILPVSIAPGLRDFSIDGQLVENLKAHIDANESPILLQPEETTSGKNCLLKFNTNVAEVSNRVQPVAVIAERPQWANTAVTVLGASATCDLFWFLFSPYTQFKLKYLSVLQREKEETPEAFTERIRIAIATALGNNTSSFTAHDKAEYEKRYLDELNRPAFASNSRAPSPEILRMSLQVSEVLPYVPREAIIRDLTRTRSIDMTISNILEGAVPYTPVIPGQSRPVLQTSILREPTFSKSSSERMSSFVERKAKMIAEARKRYIEKKGLQGLI